MKGTGLADLIYGDGQANLFWGLAGNDILFGDAGLDTLRGGDGNDILIGGSGRDVLEGGAGADVFQFTAASDTSTARDVVRDFQVNLDRIMVLGIDANTGVAGTQNFTFAGNVATAGAGTVRYGYDHGDTVLYFNQNATSTAEFSVLLRGTLVLTAADLIFA